MIASQAARVDFHTRFKSSEKAKFGGSCRRACGFRRVQECRRTAAPMKLNDFAARVDQRGHLRDFFFEIIEVYFSLVMIQRDDGGATADTSRAFHKRECESTAKDRARRDCSRGFVGQFRPGQNPVNLVAGG